MTAVQFAASYSSGGVSYNFVATPSSFFTGSVNGGGGTQYPTVLGMGALSVITAFWVAAGCTTWTWAMSTFRRTTHRRSLPVRPGWRALVVHQHQHLPLPLRLHAERVDLLFPKHHQSGAATRTNPRYFF